MSKQAIFRFYEELNDFLPKVNRKVPFVYGFDGNPTIKDAIEAIGVPHVEVDLILVNGNSVDFSYVLKNDDLISVYPVFEKMDISNVVHLREKPLRETKFILDVHLGSLARYLRMLGFDSLYRNDFDDQQIIRIAVAERRIILTRDIGILKVKLVTHGYFVRNQNPRQQIREVLKYFDLGDSIQPFSRCIKCNGIFEKVKKEEIVSQLEPITRRVFNEFFRCTSCRTVYWEGSHFERMKELIDEIRNDVL